MASERDASLSQTEMMTEMMAEDRSRASFDVEAFTRVIYGDADTQYAKTSHEDLYVDGLRMGKAVWDDRAKFGHDFFGWMTPRFALFNNSPFGLSTSMKGQINGAYMQTELGHGTFARGLETRQPSMSCETASCSTRLRSRVPSLAGSHGLRRLARDYRGAPDHQGEYYGVHPFMVQLRDIETVEVFEGVKLGDIGPKLSHNQNDNGFARLNEVVIPRVSLLSAQASVARDGTYAGRANVREKAAYGSVLVTCSKIAHVTSVQLAAG
ncbi:hypothetical protein DL771_000320 [Monosporascus sp. 5C6A]|nr:hypothetical protein DL771_000320 [Monosporascus sp. 5C6A]